jgi:hypothetical protein
MDWVRSELFLLAIVLAHTTGISCFDECLKHSAKPVKHSTNALSSVTLGKESSANYTSATTSLPSTFYRALGKVCLANCTFYCPSPMAINSSDDIHPSYPIGVWLTTGCLGSAGRREHRRKENPEAVMSWSREFAKIHLQHVWVYLVALVRCDDHWGDRNFSSSGQHRRGPRVVAGRYPYFIYTQLASNQTALLVGMIRIKFSWKQSSWIRWSCASASSLGGALFFRRGRPSR